MEGASEAVRGGEGGRGLRRRGGGGGFEEEGEEGLQRGGL